MEPEIIRRDKSRCLFTGVQGNGDILIDQVEAVNHLHVEMVISPGGPIDEMHIYERPPLPHMITLLPESSDGVIGFLIEGKLTDEDYKQGLIPPMEEAIKNQEKIRILMQMEHFEGMTAHGAWDDFMSWPKFRSVERMAFLVNDNWHEFITWLMGVYATITHTEIRFFQTEQLSEAWEWLRAP